MQQSRYQVAWSPHAFLLDYQDIVPRANDPALASQECWVSSVRLDMPSSLAFLRTTAHHSKGHQNYIYRDVHVKPQRKHTQATQARRLIV